MTDYYHNNYKEYHEKTFSIDPSSFLEPFVKRLAPGASVLDVGCGSGRDLLWLKRRGFDVTGFERSPGLAALARENSGCKVIEGDFERFDFSSLSFNAFLASGSLVHVPHERLPAVISSITKSLSRQKSSSHHETSWSQFHKGGSAYISLKQGQGTRTDEDGRVFYFWSDEVLRNLFDNQGFKVIDCSRSASAVNSKDLWLGYVMRR